MEGLGVFLGNFAVPIVLGLGGAIATAFGAWMVRRKRRQAARNRFGGATDDDVREFWDDHDWD